MRKTEHNGNSRFEMNFYNFHFFDCFLFLARLLSLFRALSSVFLRQANDKGKWIIFTLRFFSFFKCENYYNYYFKHSLHSATLLLKN